MHNEKDKLGDLIERALDKIQAARAKDCKTSLEEAHELLLRLRESCTSSDPLGQVVRDYRNCSQDLERAELLYSSGFNPTELSSVLGISSRRVYQLMRLARLPSKIKAKVRSAGISERQLRPLLDRF